MNNRFLYIFTIIASSSLFLAGCSEDNSSFETPNTTGITTNPGIISQKNFSLLTADVQPAVIDASTGIFTKTDVELTVYIGDRKNQTLTDAHTIYFKSEYGLIEPSCVTVDGACSVMWSAIARPEAGKPGSDGFVTITAYTTGEEGFTDSNGNNLFDDADAGFNDLEEPFVDIDESNTFTTGDVIIDVTTLNGVIEQHDLADGLFNGPGCTHTSLCGPQSIVIFDDVTMSIVANQIFSRTIGGSVAGLAGTGLLLNNGGDNLSITANGAYTFATPVDDGLTYAVSVSTQPTLPAQVCTVANSSGTVSANVTNADVTCVTTTYTIGGNVNNLIGTGLVLQNNGGDNLTVLNTDATYTFATPVDDGSTYAATVLTQPTGPNQICDIPANASGTASADVANADVGCTTVTYTIGGNVTGVGLLTETLTIQNNGGDDLSISADGTYTFVTAIDDDTTYGVTILTAPAINLNCTFDNTNATGTVAGADVINVDITCAP